MVFLVLLSLLMLQSSATPKTATTPRTGAWKVERSVSAMDDSQTVTLTLRARAAIRAWPSTIATPTLILRCKEGEVEAYFHTGAQAAGGADDATFTMRFDKLEPFEMVLGESTDGVAFFVGDPKPFIRQAEAHRTLLVRFTPFNSAPQETSFSLAGLGAAVQPLERACKWNRAADEAEGRARAKAEDERKEKLESDALAHAKAEDDRIAEMGTRLLNLAEPYQRRLLAAYDLNLLHPPVVAAATIAALAKALLEDPVETVRIQAATTLGKLGRGHQAARDALVEAAKTGTPLVAQNARNALTKLEGGN